MSATSFFTQLSLFLFGSSYFFVPILGIALNSYVLWRLIRIARVNILRFKTSSALPLATMSLSDSVCLFAQLTQAMFHFAVRLRYTDALEPVLLSGFCKIDLYLMHATSAFSVWCWLVLSCMRYIAVFHPFKYRTIWLQPTIAITLIGVTCVLLETWIPAMVTYESNDDFTGCIEVSDVKPTTVQAAHLSEITLSYVLPSLFRLFFDGLVLCHCYNALPTIAVDFAPLDRRRCAFSSPPIQRFSQDCESLGKRAMTWMFVITNQRTALLSARSNKCSKRKNAMLIRSLLISAVNLSCNFPSHLLRILWTVQGDTDMMLTSEWMKFAEPISQMLYFAQFTCNAFYLSTAIFETSNASGHLRRPSLISRSRSALSRVVSCEPPTITNNNNNPPNSPLLPPISSQL